MSENIGPKIRPDGWTRRENVIRALAMLVKDEMRRTEVPVMVVAARRTLAAELGSMIKTSDGDAMLRLRQADTERLAAVLGELL